MVVEEAPPPPSPKGGAVASDDRAVLETRWLTLTREVLPGLADERGLVVRADHCFQRILLDHACGGVWYDAIVGRPAYVCASDAVLECAVAAGEAVVRGDVDVTVLNRRSLEWRRARKGGA